jgi:hypothetical protein
VPSQLSVHHPGPYGSISALFACAARGYSDQATQYRAAPAARREAFMFGKRFALAPLLLTLVVAQAGPSTSVRADQPAFVWQEARQLDGRSQYVVVPHDAKWLRDQGVVVLDFTADRVKGPQGLISKDAKGNLDGGHLVVWLDDDKVVARLQDKKSNYVVQSPANTIKKGVPTRLALAFGPGGMKLYVNGKMVGSNAYQGGLQGNQEQLVIGARDWESGPRAADHLDAFFAGTVSALALYDRALEAPAIAGLGPAGTAVAQATHPATGVQPPATPEVAVAPTPPSEAPVELKMPPASVSTGGQQPVTIQPTITGDVTITQVPTTSTVTVTPDVLKAQECLPESNGWRPGRGLSAWSRSRSDRE